jgi:F0F1-type ATP synthase assembly protein I
LFKAKKAFITTFNSMKEETPNQKPINSYLRYSGIGFQLAGTVGAGVFLGVELDKWLKTSKPWFSIGCSILFLVAGFYLAFRDLLKK